MKRFIRKYITIHRKVNIFWKFYFRSENYAEDLCIFLYLKICEIRAKWSQFLSNFLVTGENEKKKKKYIYRYISHNLYSKKFVSNFQFVSCFCKKKNVRNHFICLFVYEIENIVQVKWYEKENNRKRNKEKDKKKKKKLRNPTV